MSQAYRANHELTKEDIKNLKKANELCFLSGKMRLNGKYVWGSWIQCRFKVRGHDGETTCLIPIDAVFRDYREDGGRNKTHIESIFATVSLHEYDSSQRNALMALIRPGDIIQARWILERMRPDFSTMQIHMLTADIIRKSKSEQPYYQPLYEFLIDYRMCKPDGPGIIDLRYSPVESAS